MQKKLPNNRFILLIILTFQFCSVPIKKVQQIDKEMVFDSLMKELTLKYPVIPKPHPENLKFSQVYQIDKLVYLPFSGYSNDSAEVKEIFIELRSFSRSGGGWNFEMIYFYNNEFHFVLPLSDNYLYWKKSCYQDLNDDELNKKICFNKELNELLKQIKIVSPNIFYKILDEIMNVLNCYTLTKYDISKLKSFAEINKNDTVIFRKNCKSLFYENISKVERKIIENNFLETKIYTDGVLIYIIDIKQDKNNTYTTDIEVLNRDCFIRFLW